MHTPLTIRHRLTAGSRISIQLGCFLAFASAIHGPYGYGQEWMTWASTYTHEAASGARVDQYALPEQPLGPARGASERNVFRNTRSTLQVGQSADNYHVVEQWGREVQPYEQWRFPFRPYGVPYDAWGPQAPYGIINGQFGGGVFPPGQFPGQFPGQYGGQLPGGQPFAPGAGGGRQGFGNQPLGNQHPGGYWTPGNAPFAAPGFPLQPAYGNQPWFDGTYPDAPPLNTQSDREFFYHAPLGRQESNPRLGR